MVTDGIKRVLERVERVEALERKLLERLDALDVLEQTLLDLLEQRHVLGNQHEALRVLYDEHEAVLGDWTLTMKRRDEDLGRRLERLDRPQRRREWIPVWCCVFCTGLLLLSLFTR